MTSFQPSVLGAEVWPPPSSQGHSSTFVSFPPGAMPSRAASHAARVFLRPMKSSLFPGVSHAHGLGPGDISPSAALGGAEDASCPSAFVWSFVPSITAGTVCRRGRGAGSAARRRPTAAASHALGGCRPGSRRRSSRSGDVFHACQPLSRHPWSGAAR